MNIKTRRSAFQNQQNKVRGVIGDATRRGKEAIDGPAVYREGVRRVLLESRREIGADQTVPFLKWVTSLRPRGVSQTRHPLAFDPARPIIKSKPIPFHSELNWIVARLAPHLVQLREFRASAIEIDKYFWAGDAPKATSILDEIETRFGQSIWSIELGLALAQHQKGLDGQKALLKSIKDTWKSGLPAYLAHFYSIRNEDRSTMRLFRDDANSRINQSKLFPQAITYLKYKIADEFSATDGDMSCIVRSEQLQSIIDIYETTIDIFQRLIKRSKHQRYREGILRCIDAWREINDFRLEKIEAALGQTSKTTFALRPNCGIYALAAGKPAEAYRSAKQSQSADPSNIWAGLEFVLSGSILERKAAPSFDTPWRLINEALQDALQRNDNFEDGSGYLEKFSRNFHCLHGATALGDFVSFATGAALGSTITIAATSLSTPFWGPEDLYLAASGARSLLYTALSNPRHDTYLRAWVGDVIRSENSPLENGFSLYLGALRLISENPNAALIHLRAINTDSIPSILRAFVLTLRIDLALGVDNLSEAISDIAYEAAHSPAARSVLPAEAALGDRDWHDLESKGSKLDLAIALDVIWRKTDNDLYGSYLRFALEDYLAENSCGSPSQLSFEDHEDRHKKIYLLRYIAVPQVMDLTGLFETSRDVVDERIAVCEKLKLADSENFTIYDDEMYNIKNQLLISDGLRIVDTSRINVDTAGVSRWAERRYKESFGRYKALVDAGVGVANDIEDLIRKMTKSHDLLGEYFNVPDNEADTLLLEIVVAIRDEFLNNPDHGLEFFLGKRIRHGTVSGHLRGPLESANLITQRESVNKDYKRNDEWLDRLTYTTPSDEQSLDVSFRDFAKHYDEIARRLKDEFLHVKSKQHPKGVFDIVVTVVAYQLIRSALKNEFTFEGFLLTCFTVFWTLLEPSLISARNLLSPDAKDDAAKLFDELQNKTGIFALHDDAYHELSVAIRSTASAVQRQFDSMLEWLTRTEIEQASHLFKLHEVVDIAVKSAFKTHSAFEPSVELDVDDAVHAPISILIVLSEIVFVIIDNACRRSMAGKRPIIRISCHVNRSEETILLEVVNNVGNLVDRIHVEQRLDVIRKRIATNDIQSGALADEGSGLLKIANITQQSEKNLLEFGFIADNKFRTAVTLSVLIEGGSMVLTPLDVS